MNISFGLKKPSLALLLFLIFSGTGFSQKVIYTGYDVPVELPPAYPQYKDYSTYDLSTLSLITNPDKSVNNYDLPYQIKLGNLKQTTSQGDFHVVANIERFIAKLTSKSTANLNVTIKVKIFDRNGTLIKTSAVARDAMAMSIGRHFTDEEIKNQRLLSTVMIQNVIDTALSSFNNAFNGVKFKTEIIFGSLSGVKKMPELKEFSDQIDNISKASVSSTATEFKSTLEKSVPYWEKMANYAGEGEVNEVKRAAYQNLAMFNILAGKLDKAKEYIEIYKPIDKVFSAMFGLLKVKYSEECEKKLGEFYPNAFQNTTQVVADTKIVTKEDLLDLEKFVTINGSVSLKGKRHTGTYTGVTKITRYAMPSGSGNIASLDKASDDMFVEGKDENGNVVKFSGSSLDLVSAKADNGDMYVMKSLGAMFGVGGESVFMKSSYNSSKITVYRNYFKETEDFFIVKTGDAEGLKYADSKSRKKLAEYLSDCTDLVTKLKDKTVAENEKIEKIAELYTNCN
jgi:hypothetical protein